MCALKSLSFCLFVSPDRNSTGRVTHQYPELPQQPDLLCLGLELIWGLKVTLFEKGSKTLMMGKVPSLSPHKVTG